jgi:hypothetical protein
MTMRLYEAVLESQEQWFMFAIGGICYQFSLFTTGDTFPRDTHGIQRTLWARHALSPLDLHQPSLHSELKGSFMAIFFSSLNPNPMRNCKKPVTIVFPIWTFVLALEGFQKPKYSHFFR